MSREKLIVDIKEVYDSGKLKPIRGTTYSKMYPDGPCGCAMAAAYIANNKDPLYVPLFELTENLSQLYDLDDSYFGGLITGFDCKIPLSDCHSEDFNNGYEDGEKLCKEYNPALYVKY